VKHLGEPSRWQLTLSSGESVDVWADAYSEADGFYVFGVLVDVANEPADHVLVSARTPSNPARMEVAVARFPVGVVSDISTVSVGVTFPNAGPGDATVGL
jgi:hypothetical protein